MPIKLRSTKRKVSTEARYAVWACIFDCGYDFFSELPDIGVLYDGSNEVPDEYARPAWSEFGERYMSEADRINPGRADKPLWAEQEFGRPWETSHAD